MNAIGFLLKYIKKYSKICLFISLCIICFISLKIYNHTRPLPGQKRIHSNLENIQVKDPTHFSFAVFGGSKISRLVYKGFLEQVDHDPEIAFAVDLGDAVLKGRKPHYKYFIKQIDSNLGIPLLNVMGDNELSGEGRELYKRIFGPFYYSFEIGKSYFIVLDNAGENGLDLKQLGWIENELKDSENYDNRIIFLHTPFYDPGKSNIMQPVQKETSLKLINLLLKYQVTHIFASQRNGFYEGNLRGIPYTLTGGAERAAHSRHRKRGFYHFLKVKIENDRVDVELKQEFSPGFYRTKHIKYRPVSFMDYLIRVHWLEISFLAFALISCLFFILRKRKAGKGNKE